MFQHIGMLTLVDEATAENADAIVAGLLALPATIPGLVEAKVDRDAGLTPGNATLVFHLTFADQAAWEGYRTHPDHVAVIKERIAPVLAAKTFVQVAA
ncbi:Dabb family protein [Actinoplanes derwentensis]|uniref:Stress responsive A/B Barrel Domain n=1 Tax=Actinoplanes derwentensis TaxID=113562 RepID=A0A1H1ZSB0_9ACTN|nr:Dabb family protein [Actinoplanes derwentensis]GID89185.1 hypothetical protein Ade03nite_81090 [Actinoplanes derwentensis]SDT36489.1 Stress responsive A/B Barrel Domain [Actinoplanes derwentensis]